MKEEQNSIMLPEITTIIPTYKRPRMLRRAIKSAAGQSYGNIRICVYDNASGDGTGDVVREISKSDPRILYHCHEENTGSHENFMYGMKNVRTKYFSFLSDDDVLLPEFYMDAVEKLEKYPEAAFCAGRCICMTGEGLVTNVTARWDRGGYFTPEEGILNIAKYPPTWTSVLFRSDIINKIGMIDAEVGRASDRDFIMRAASEYPFYISEKPYSIFFVHEMGTSYVPDLQAVYPGWLKMIGNLMRSDKISEGKKRELEEVLMRNYRRLLSGYGRDYIRNRKYEIADQIATILSLELKAKRQGAILHAAAAAGRHFPWVMALLHIPGKLFPNSDGPVNAGETTDYYREMGEKYGKFLLG